MVVNVNTRRYELALSLIHIYSETQLARIGHRLARLYQIMQENRSRVDEERQALQTLESDTSHQVKTPVSNLKMATDTLLEKPMTEAERTEDVYKRQEIFRSCAAVRLPASNKETVQCTALSQCSSSGGNTDP